MFSFNTLSCLFRVLFLLPIPLTYTNALTVNVSIDDSSPDPLTGAVISYALTNEIGVVVWNVGQTCTICEAMPDPSQTFDQSWHDASTKYGENIPIATVFFTGTAVYVMGIIVTSCPETNSPLNSSRIFFEIDGVVQGNFMNYASIGPEVTYEYNTTLFAQEGLSSALHNITIRCGDGTPQPAESICLLDRIIYTTQVDTNNGTSSATSSVTSSASSSSTSNTTNSVITASSPSTSQASLTSQTSQARSKGKTRLSAGAIAGIVFGCISVLAAVAGGFYLLGRRKPTPRLASTQTQPVALYQSPPITREVRYTASQTSEYDEPESPLYTGAVHELERQERSGTPEPTVQM